MTLVTVAYNSADDLQAYWAGRDLSECRWVVVDNASADASADVARALGADSVIELDKNVGFSAANNIGLRAAATPFIGFVNPDVAIGDREVGTLVKHIDAVGGLVAPQLVYPDGKAQPNGRGMPTIWAKLRNRVMSVNAQYHLTASIGHYRRVPWAMGAAIFGRRTNFEAVGGWDERYFVYYEDADLCLRAATAGILTSVCGSAKATHGWARQTARLNIRAWRHEFASARVFYSSYPRLLFPASGGPADWDTQPICPHDE